MPDWDVLHGGRVKRFRNRQVRHHCSKRRHGRPAVGRGLCYRVNQARAIRRALAAQLRAAGHNVELLEEFAFVVPRGDW